MIISKKLSQQVITGALIATVFFLAAPGLVSAQAELSPHNKVQLQTLYWIDNNADKAAILLNGKELLSCKATSAVPDLRPQLEKLSEDLQIMLNDKSFDPNNMLPAKVGTMACIRLNGKPAVIFNKCITQLSELAASLHLINEIRLACHVRALPASCLKLISKQTTTVANSFSGHASWYGPKFHGKRTSSGHKFDQNELTAAHRNLPFGTKLLVMNRKTGNTCVVEINDRGPFVGNRVIDLSKAAARQLDMLSQGVAFVDCLILK